MSTISVPWVPWQPELSPNGKPVVICPTCHTHIEEPHLKGMNYYNHYITQHPEGTTTP